MTRRFPLKTAVIALVMGLLAACSSIPGPVVHREGVRGNPVTSQADAGSASTSPLVDADGSAALPAPGDAVQPVIHRGSGQVIDNAVAASPPPNLGGSTGEASFNFEGTSLPAVVKAILGDMLGQNYVIAPGVQGQVTVGTPKPVNAAQALSLLQQILAWNNARMIYSDGRYNIVPADKAMATGVVAPRTGPPISSHGFETRVVPLRYVGAEEMKKILQPYARPDAIVSVDPGRNVITIGGSPSELENYLRTIAIFDVDWMSSMSVGVYPLQSGNPDKVVESLEKVFGQDSKSPVAGMFRFMPLDGANAVMVITSQPSYLDRIQDWIDRIDGAGGGVQLYSYELKYIKAKDLADRLSEVFGGGSGGGSSGGTNNGASMMPGLQPTEIRDGGVDADSSMGSAQIGGDNSAMGDSLGANAGGGDASGGMQGTLQLSQKQSGNGSVQIQVQGEQVGVSAVEETNTLLVRTSARAWKSIRDVIDRLDVMPLQVHIEAQIAQVQLQGDLNYGVDWYFKNALSGNLPAAVTGIRNAVSGGVGYTIFSGSAAAVLNALDSVTDVRMLATPSVFVRNNGEADYNVGENIPIQSVTFDTNTNTNGTYSQVQYLQTGKILKVRPRITRDGMVFLDIVQEISSANDVPSDCSGTNCNPRIKVSKLKTEAAVQSGETVMLAGLIDDQSGHYSDGIPGLSRIPIIGGLFGSQRHNKSRNETIILITPTIVRNPQEARDLTDEYSRRFRAMEPIDAPHRR